MIQYPYDKDRNVKATFLESRPWFDAVMSVLIVAGLIAAGIYLL